MNNVEWLEEWYQNHCNGYWEHFYGIEIETLDNPGWHIKIELDEINSVEFKEREWSQNSGNNNWIICSIKNNTFDGCGDCMKLEEIIQIFRQWVEGE